MAYYVYPNGEAHEFNFVPGASSVARKVSKAEYLIARKAYVVAQLHKLISPGDMVYTVNIAPNRHRVLVPTIDDNGHHLVGHGKPAQAGHDFWLTRCSHGTGFWDRGDDVWPKAARDAMDECSRKAGNRDMEVGDDGRIHIM